jgi:hypothetical protein
LTEISTIGLVLHLKTSLKKIENKISLTRRRDRRSSNPHSKLDVVVGRWGDAVQEAGGAGGRGRGDDFRILVP